MPSFSEEEPLARCAWGATGDNSSLLDAVHARARSAAPRGAGPGPSSPDRPYPVEKARYWWTDRTAAEPSPTAAATRLVDPERTSPTAKRPG